MEEVILRQITSYGPVNVRFPVIRETEKAIQIKAPVIAGSGYNAFPTGREKEVWLPKAALNRKDGAGILLSSVLWDRICDVQPLRVLAWMLQSGNADPEEMIFTIEYLAEAAKHSAEVQ